MTHQPAIPADLGRDRTVRRWSPRLGYAMALGGSAVVWSIVAVAIKALV